MAQCLFLLSVVAVSLTFSTVTSALECDPGYKVNGNQCEECPTGSFNAKRDSSISCSYCSIQCSFQKGVITANCTTTNDLKCDCQEGYEKKTLGEETICKPKTATVPQETTTSIPAISTTENPGKPKVPQETSTSMPAIATTESSGKLKAQVHIPLILLSLLMSYIVLYYII